MKTLAIFGRDVKVALRQFIMVWIILAPILLAFIVRIASPGIADHWRQKIATRIDWLCKNTGQTPPPVVAFHVKPENP